MDFSAIMLVMVLVPGVAGLITLGLGRARAVAGAVSSISSLVALLMAGVLVYELSARGITREVLWHLDVAGMAWEFELTRLNALSIFFIALLGFLIALYSTRYIAKYDGKGYYHTLILWSMSAAIVALTSENWIPFLAFWEVCNLTLFFLVRAGGSEARMPAYRTLILLASCDLLMAVGVALAVSQTHSLEITRLTGLSPHLTGLIFALMLISALAKAGGIPFHTWIPDIAPSSPASTLALFPGAYDKLLGIFKLVVICHFLISFAPSLSATVTIIGMITMLFAVLMAMVQHDIYKLLSYHAISQVGYMITGIGIGTSLAIAGGLFHMVNNVVFKSCLFLTAGAALYVTGTKHVERLGGLAKKMPVTFTCALIAALAISGVPPLNGFASKWMIYQAAFEATSISPINAVAGIVAVLASALTLASFVKYLHSVFLGPLPKEYEGVREVPLSMRVPMIVLAALCVLFGLFPQIPLNYLILPTLNNIYVAYGVPVSLPPSWIYLTPSAWATWSPVIATLVALLALALGWAFYSMGKRIQPFAPRPEALKPFVSGEDLVVHYHGGHFYGSSVKLSFKGLYAIAERGGFSIIWRAIASPFEAVLRSPRNGVFLVYALWVMTVIAIMLLGGGL
jgi:multicomponent Na+:H+ antiporter subunit A